MQISPLQPGTYIVAVSGGVDSMVLLYLLHANHQPPTTNHQLIVAHLDHGIRPDSHKDRQLVEQTAQNMGLEFVYTQAAMGSGASEAAARKVRYAFLRSVMKDYKADAIITAHHQDDRIETAIINIIRGTGRKGLSSLASKPGLVRPLLDIPKKDIYAYAHQHHIAWREDTTNTDTTYVRNHVRHNIVPLLTSDQREHFLTLLGVMQGINDEIDDILEHVSKESQLNRNFLCLLNHAESMELIAHWLRRHGYRDFNNRQLAYLTIKSKTVFSGRLSVNDGQHISIANNTLALRGIDR